ncbi:type I-E CRISPR-associated protein Cse1/CasA [Pseudoflavonifractor sp. MSJ-37]|uniref:type I-E CRISPR-associated protein Cse1/CasA n=1 Tax=Pseudoflavonifractor sp. MSJ-37 TaxID=2841531 RepID=UPI001C0FBAE6|nr:type I-E CRISPR-associated protein Cse1/CasA [Pseudoflavonifractor sp. MSJ-37]MBU5434213.1 type I-E CRISPR-associated protein Cse1/CasA [Pseudoflavonifractor sp. MSJ-37]
MELIEFNLLEEPWIRVMTEDCTVQERSLTQVLLESHKYRRLAGELPTQDVAVLRLLLAVLHTVFYRVDSEGEDDPIEEEDQAIERWRELWEAGHLPEPPIRDYLEAWKDRFWLFHPEHPFYQVPGAGKGTGYTAAKLNGELSESSNKLRLFPIRAGREKERLTYAEAARWLVTIMGFDDVSTKVETGTGPGWLGQHIDLYATGDDLFETLMLNLVFTSGEDTIGEDTIWEESVPAWEKPPLKEAKKRQVEMPKDQAGLLTLQSRRILLYRESDRVVAYRVTGGDFFGKDGDVDAFNEQMTRWRKEERSRTKKFFRPAKANPERQMWRDFETIIDEKKEGHRPGIVRWVQELKKAKAMGKKIVHISSVGAVYDAKGSSIVEVVADHLDFHAELLDEVGGLWNERIRQTIERVDKAAWLLGKLAEELFRAGGGLPDSPTQTARVHQAKQEYYGAVDLPFRGWLRSINPKQGNEEELRAEKDMEWRRTAYRLAMEQGRRMVRSAGAAAFTGRWVKDRKTDREICLSSSSAFDRFSWSIRKCFGIETKKEGEADG